MSIEVGSILEGRVTGITNFGAFVEVTEGVTGLVHISEIADTYVKDIKDFIKENDVVKVKVINLDKGKIGLSIRQVNGSTTRQFAKGRVTRNFEDRLQRFMKESDERQQDIKKSTDSKRGGRGTRRAF